MLKPYKDRDVFVDCPKCGFPEGMSTEHRCLSEAGGKKYDSNKPRPELVPPRAFLEMCGVFAHGAKKYGDDNWRRVEDARMRYIAAALRHIYQELSSPDKDESGYSHLAHAAASILMAMESPTTNPIPTGAPL